MIGVGFWTPNSLFTCSILIIGLIILLLFCVLLLLLHGGEGSASKLVSCFWAPHILPPSEEKKPELDGAEGSLCPKECRWNPQRASVSVWPFEGLWHTEKHPVGARVEQQPLRPHSKDRR